MKRYSASLIIREMQVKTTVRRINTYASQTIPKNYRKRNTYKLIL